MKGKTSPEERIQALAFLRERYPNAFRPSEDVKPLQIGIKGKLVAEITDNLPEGLSLRAIYVALHYYCCTREYKKVRKMIGNPRINLAGEVVGEVTQADLAVGTQMEVKKQQEKAEKLAKQKALEAKRLEKQSASTAPSLFTARKPVKVNGTVGAKVWTERGPKKPYVANHHKSNGSSTNSNKTFVKPTSNRSSSTHPVTPTIIVRKKRTLNFSPESNQDKKAEE